MLCDVPLFNQLPKMNEPVKCKCIYIHFVFDVTLYSVSAPDVQIGDVPFKS